MQSTTQSTTKAAARSARVTKIWRGVFTWCCVGTLAFFAITALTRAFTQNALRERFHMDNAFTRLVFFDREPGPVTVPIDWAARYPFERDAAATATAAPATAATAMTTTTAPPPLLAAVARCGKRLDAARSRVFAIEKKIEQYTGESLVFRVPLVETAVRLETLAGWRVFMNGTVVDLGGGYLAEPTGRAGVNTLAEALAALRGFAAAQGAAFLYVQAPHKIQPEDVLPVPDYTNANADALLAALAAVTPAVPVLDLRAAAPADLPSRRGLFYRTDHHWKAETGLWAAGLIAAALAPTLAPTLAPERYRFETHEQIFLGSLGKKITLIHAPPDDFTLIYPRFETSFTLTIPSRAVDVTGGFSVFYDYDQVAGQIAARAEGRASRRDYYAKSPYAAYLYGDQPVITVVNRLAGEGAARILVIKDSFGNVVNPFLACVAGRVDILDLRHFTGSVRASLRETRPDTVVVLYNPSGLNGESTGDLFDFR